MTFAVLSSLLVSIAITCVLAGIRIHVCVCVCVCVVCTCVWPQVERDMREAEAGPNYKALAIQQSQMLEALFEVSVWVCTYVGVRVYMQTTRGAHMRSCWQSSICVCIG